VKPKCGNRKPHETDALAHKKKTSPQHNQNKNIEKASEREKFKFAAPVKKKTQKKKADLSSKLLRKKERYCYCPPFSTGGREF